MDLQDLDEIVAHSRNSAFRLETLPQYLVPQEADEFEAWRAGRPSPLATPETSPWLARLKNTTAHGYRWYRAHILDHPLSDYSRFELHGYQANAFAGEEIYLADRHAHPDLEGLRQDFWLIDDEIAVLMVYDVEGHFVRPERADDPAPYRRMREVALRYAEPFDAYLARTRPRLTA